MKTARHILRSLSAARLARAGLLLLLAAAVSGLGACARNQIRQVYPSAAVKPQNAKRYELYPTFDWYHRCTYVAYKKPQPWKMRKLPAEKQNIMAEWGMPDYIRRPFISRSRERVHEWVYIDNDRMFQFIGGKVVYEGPITDFERLLISRGYPSKYMTVREDTKQRIDLLIYDHLFSPQFDQYRLQNGYIIQSAEGY